MKEKKQHKRKKETEFVEQHHKSDSVRESDNYKHERLHSNYDYSREDYYNKKKDRGSKRDREVAEDHRATKHKYISNSSNRTLDSERAKRKHKHKKRKHKETHFKREKHGHSSK